MCWSQQKHDGSPEQGDKRKHMAKLKAESIRDFEANVEAKINDMKKQREIDFDPVVPMLYKYSHFAFK